MSKQRKIKGDGNGVPITVWVSEELRQALEEAAQAAHTKKSTVARQVLEERFVK